MHNTQNILYKKWTSIQNLNLKENSLIIPNIIETFENIKINDVDDVDDVPNHDQTNILLETTCDKIIENIKNNDVDDAPNHDKIINTVNNPCKFFSYDRWLNVKNYNLSDNVITMNDFKHIKLENKNIIQSNNYDNYKINFFIIIKIFCLYFVCNYFHIAPIYKNPFINIL